MGLICKKCGGAHVRLCFAAQGLDIVNFFNPWAWVSNAVKSTSNFFGEECSYTAGLVCGSCGAYHVGCRNCEKLFLVPDLPIHNNAYRCPTCNGKCVVNTNGGIMRQLAQEMIRR